MLYLKLYIDQISEGYVILITGLVIVFSALLLLTAFFKFGLPVLLYTYKIITKRRDKKITFSHGYAICIPLRFIVGGCGLTKLRNSSKAAFRLLTKLKAAEFISHFVHLIGGKEMG